MLHVGSVSSLARWSATLALVASCEAEPSPQLDPSGELGSSGTGSSEPGDAHEEGSEGTSGGAEPGDGVGESSTSGDEPVDGGPLELLEATIPAAQTDVLELHFNRPVDGSAAQGVRLVGGAASIIGEASRPEPNVLSFPLSDHVLPDDEFTVTVWAEFGAIRTADDDAAQERLDTIEGFAVHSEARAYDGAGTIYYVADGGSDAASGSRDQPLATLAAAAQLAEPGDYVLLRRGDAFALSSGPSGAFRGHFEPPRSGTAEQPITYAAYGSGERPRLEAPSGGSATIAVRGVDSIHLDNLHIVADRGDYGVVFAGDSDSPSVTHCTVRALDDDGGYGGIYYAASVEGAHVRNPQVRFNDVSGFRTNFSSNGYDMSDRHEVVDGGLLEGNFSGPVSGDNGHDGFKAARGAFGGLIIRKNRITGWLDDGLETFGATDVVVEHNTLYSPLPPVITEGSGNHASQGIKAGGTDSTNGYHAERITVRYNAVYDLPYDAASVGIKVNGGRSGEIYGNVVHDVRRIGIKVDCNPCTEMGWRVHHNTVVGAGTEAIQVYNGGDYGDRVEIFNNILDGTTEDLRVTTGNGGSALGGGNVLVHGSSSGDYVGEGDVTGALAALFVDLDGRDLHLVPDAPAREVGSKISGYDVDRDGWPVMEEMVDAGAYSVE